MSELLKATSGANTSTSGEVNVGESQTSTSGDAKTYDPKFVEKILKEKKNMALTVAEMQAQLESFQRKEAELEESKLIQTKQHEVVISNLKAEREKLANELKNERETVKRARINTAYISELKKLGFIDSESNREAAIKLADLKGIDIDPTTNTVVGVEDGVKSFYEKFGTLGLFEKKSSTTSNAAPGYNKQIGTPDVHSMSKQEKLQMIANLAAKK